MARRGRLCLWLLRLKFSRSPTAITAKKQSHWMQHHTHSRSVLHKCSAEQNRRAASWALVYWHAAKRPGPRSPAFGFWPSSSPSSHRAQTGTMSPEVGNPLGVAEEFKRAISRRVRIGGEDPSHSRAESMMQAERQRIAQKTNETLQHRIGAFAFSLRILRR